MEGFAPSLAMEEWTEITAKDRLSQQKKRFFFFQKPGDENDRVRMSVLFKQPGQHYIKKKWYCGTKNV
jgi:hypothetical protein